MENKHGIFFSKRRAGQFGNKGSYVSFDEAQGKIKSVRKSEKKKMLQSRK